MTVQAEIILAFGLNRDVSKIACVGLVPTS